MVDFINKFSPLVPARIVTSIFIATLISTISFGSAYAQQGQVRIHGMGIDASTLDNKTAQTIKISAQFGPPIGIVESVNSPAAVQHVNGTVDTLKPGSSVFKGDKIITGDSGSAVLFMKDESTVSIDANSQIIMDELIYNPGHKQGSEIISLIKGVAVFASGNIAKFHPEAMMVQTPVATIGIRGTTFGLHYRSNRNLSVVLAEDNDGTVGEIFIRNQAGAVTLNQKYHATTVAGLNVPPTAPAIMPAQNFLNTFNDAIMQMPARKKRMLNQPSNTDRDPMRQLREELLRR
jgi:hypothetical protein